MNGKEIEKQHDVLLQDLRSMIDDARRHVACEVDSTLSMLYWHIGQRIQKDILGSKRADYGKEIVVTVSRQLIAEFGSGFSEKNLWRMVQFSEVFPEKQIVVTLSRELSWSHFLSLIPIKDELKRNFYAEMSRVERWSVRTLRKKINGMLFERTALSRKPAELAKQEIAVLRDEDKLSLDLVFRDPYLLDFLGLT